MNDELLITKALAVQREIERSRRHLDDELRKLKQIPGLSAGRTVQKLGGNGLLALLAGGAGWYFSKPQHVTQAAGVLRPLWSQWQKFSKKSQAKQPAAEPASDPPAEPEQ